MPRRINNLSEWNKDLAAVYTEEGLFEIRNV